MPLTNTRTGLESLDRDECLRLLAADENGRLVVADGSDLVVLLVEYVLDDGDIMFPPGTPLHAGPGRPARFEIHDVDEATGVVLCVVVTGCIEEATSFDATWSWRVDRSSGRLWARHDTPPQIRLVPTRIIGRRIGPRH